MYIPQNRQAGCGEYGSRIVIFSFKVINYQMDDVLIITDFGVVRCASRSVTHYTYSLLVGRSGLDCIIGVHPAEARAGVEKGGHADSTWSCVQGLQIGRSACPPACCTTPSAFAATSTPAPNSRTAKRSSPSSKSPRPAAAPPAGRP